MSNESRLLVADSFRVQRHPETGRAEVRGWSRHLGRFSRAVAEVSASEPSRPWSEAALQEFLRESAHRIAAYGDGFPRLEYWQDAGETRFSLSLRPAPPLGNELEMRTAPGVFLDHAGRKGPNIARLREVNLGLGAEALLLDPIGQVLEGATTSLVWWEPGGSTAHVVARAHADAEPASANRVPSITECLLVDAVTRRNAPDRGDAADTFDTVRIEAGLATPARLVESEVWAVNALHGIRVVTAIDGQSTLPPDGHRLERFRAELDQTWELVRPLSPANG